MFQSEGRARVIKLFACVGFLACVSVVYAFSSGPLPGFTGAPGEGHCTECHDSFGEETNQGNGFVAIDGPARYEAGERLTVTVSVGQPGAQRWGFQITALTTDTDEPAGQFVITDPLHTQLIQGESGRWYVEHTEAGSFAGQAEGATWTFDWVAPETDVGPVIFYAAGNAANNDGMRLGDWIYTTIASVSPPSYPGVTLLAPNGAEVLGLGQPFTIRWEAVRADEVDILFFPRPGVLPETLASGLPGDRRAFEWTAPAVAAEAARIAVLAFNNAGFGIDESASPFVIADRSASLLRVLEPSEQQVVKGGDILRVTWNAACTLTVVHQQIRLSLDGGRTYPLMLAASLPASARSFDWLVPTNLRTSSARVLVLARTADGQLVADDNDTDFVIDNPAAVRRSPFVVATFMAHRGTAINRLTTNLVRKFLQTFLPVVPSQPTT